MADVYDDQSAGWAAVSERDGPEEGEGGASSPATTSLISPGGAWRMYFDTTATRSSVDSSSMSDMATMGEMQARAWVGVRGREGNRGGELGHVSRSLTPIINRPRHQRPSHDGQRGAMGHGDPTSYTLLGSPLARVVHRRRSSTRHRHTPLSLPLGCRAELTSPPVLRRPSNASLSPHSISTSPGSQRSASSRSVHITPGGHVDSVTLPSERAHQACQAQSAD